MNRWRRAVAAVGVAGALILGGAGAAFADAPVPNMPDRDIGGGLLSVGNDANPGSCADGTTFFECYGVSGQFYTDPDTGLVNGVGDQTKAAGNSAANLTANILMTMAQASTAATAKFADNVYTTGDYQQPDVTGAGSTTSGNWLGAFEPLWTSIAGGLKEGFTEPFAPIIASIVLISAIVGVIRGSFSKALTTFLLAFVAVGAITVGTDYPIQAGRGADKLITESTTELREAITGTDNASSPGYALVGGVADRIIYDRWVAGELGDSTSPTAQKYGPILYKAQAYSWDEMRQVRADPNGAGKTILERKQKEWNDAKEAIKDEDPDAYAYLTGDKGAGNRVMQGFMMNVVWWTAMPMILVSLGFTALAFLVIRLVVVFLPIIALVAMIPKFHGAFKSTAELFLAAIVNAVIFGTVATLVAVVNTFIMADSVGLDWGTQLLFAGLFTILAWSATSPFRKLTRFATRFDPVGGVTGVLERIYSLLKSLMGVAFAGAAGGAVAAKAVAKDSEEAAEQEDRSPKLYRQTFTRPDRPVLGDVVYELHGSPQPVSDVVDGEVVEAVGSAPMYETHVVASHPVDADVDVQPVVFNDDSTIATYTEPKEAHRMNDGTYLLYDGGRYVIDTVKSVEGESADA